MHQRLRQFNRHQAPIFGVRIFYFVVRGRSSTCVVVSGPQAVAVPLERKVIGDTQITIANLVDSNLVSAMTSVLVNSGVRCSFFCQLLVFPVSSLAGCSLSCFKVAFSLCVPFLFCFVFVCETGCNKRPLVSLWCADRHRHRPHSPRSRTGCLLLLLLLLLLFCFLFVFCLLLVCLFVCWTVCWCVFESVALQSWVCRCGV